jgi:hypothetical protein
MQRQLAERINWHVADYVNSEQLELDSIIQLPVSTYDTFHESLSSRLGLLEFTKGNQQQISDFAETFRQGRQADTQAFANQIAQCIEVIRERGQLMLRLHKHLRTTGQSVTEMFIKLIRGLGTYKDDFLGHEEYLAVLQAVGLKDIVKDKQKLFLILTSLPNNAEQKIDYHEFINGYDNVVKGKSKTGKRVVGLSTRRMMNNYRERVQAIVEVLPQRPTVNLGALLSGCDSNKDRLLKRDQFYRVIDGLQSKLGEGDILELIKDYDPMGRDEIDIQRFADDVNAQTFNRDCWVVLNDHLVSGAIAENIVDPIEFTPRSKERSKLRKFRALIFDLLIGLTIAGKRLRGLLMEHAKQSGKALTRSELLAAFASLNVLPYDHELKEEFFDTLARIEGNDKKPAQSIQIQQIEEYALDICTVDDQ